MQDDTIPAAKSLAHQVSKISWVIGLINILLLAISRGTPVIVELTVPILVLAGVACSVAALIGIRRHAIGGVRVPAIAGLVINGLLLSFFTYNLLFVGDGPHSRRAKQGRAQAAAQIKETPNDPKPGEGSAASFSLAAAGNADSPADNAETKYLVFQVQTGLYGYASQFRPPPGRFSLTKAQMEEFVHSVMKAIGTTGDARNKLAFAVGPLCFDMSDEETRQFIRDAFAVARENDVAVALHIDDSMGWGERKDLISNPDNIETADWKQTPNTGRRMDWGRTPMKFAPQMCFNAPAIQAAVKDRGTLVGAEVKKEMDALQTAGKEHLFAGIIAGWETRIGRDFETDRPLGYRALSHRGFSESNPPKDTDHERVLVVKEFIELWANALHAPGVPREKIYCHIAFTAQGLDRKEKFQTVSTFALPEVAFGSAYRPGFSTYPDGAALKQVQDQVAAHGSPAWISAEGTNVSPTGMPSGLTMETYLGRMFNHGAVMVNIFAWGIGGEARRNHFFRRAAEDPEPLAAYAKFLRGEELVESAAQGLTVEALETKMHRIQTELPGWIQKTGQQAQAMSRIDKIKALAKEGKWQEADKAADEVLALMKGESPVGAQVEPSSLMERLPPKIHKIQAELPTWMEKTGNKEAAVLMQKLQEQIKAKNFEEVEKTADSILRLIDGSASPSAQGGDSKPRQAPQAAGESAIRFSIGNLSVPLLMQAWDSPMLKKLPADPEAATAQQRSSFITKDRKIKVQAIEDYVGWGVVEPEEGKWDWTEYQENARAIKQAGFEYVVFGWVQNLPRWVRGGHTYPRAACVEHHKETEMLSLFSPRTVAAYDRFYGKMRAELGESVDLIRIGSPFDYGEVAYPAGAADWAFPASHVHEGFWVDEPEARAHFRRAMEVRYATPERLNAAWGTAFASFAKLDYPRDNGSKRHWLDFVNWYYDALTERMGLLVDTVRKHFPQTPLLFSLGWPYEKVVNGHDISGLMAMAAAKNVEVRIGTGPSVSFLSLKRGATAAHFYQLRGLSSEPTNGEAPREALAVSLFQDLTAGVTWHFDYEKNIARATELFQQADAIWRSGAYPKVEAALFLATSAHRLAAPQKPGGTAKPEKVDDYPGYPDGLSAFAERLRDAVDFDVVDERLVGDGALKSYRVVIWPTGYVAEAATLSKIRQWVQAGGTLLVGDLAQVETVEGERVFGDLRGDATGRTTLGRGIVIDGRGRLEFSTTNWRQDLFATRRGYQIDSRVTLQGWLDALRTSLGDGADAALDDPADGVLVSRFPDGWIAFNSGTKQVKKSLGSGGAGRQEVELPPLALRWVTTQGAK